MNTADCIEFTLARVVERIGDPAPRVYQRLFAELPALQALFVNDARGSVRGEMFHRAIEALTDLAGERPHAPGMLTAERINHEGLGVTAAQFEQLFTILVQVFREVLGADWTAEIDAAWRQVLRRAADATGAPPVQR